MTTKKIQVIGSLGSEVDSTLTQEGKAADAKITGDALSTLNTLVGDKAVSEQINTAIASKSDVGHTHTASEIGADASGAAASALTSAKSYTDTKIAALVNSAPTTLDTLGEIATAMQENDTVVDALEDAIGTKANASDLTSHTGNKSNPHGVTAAQISAVPTSRTVNGKALSANITLSASDVGINTNSTGVQNTLGSREITDEIVSAFRTQTQGEAAPNLNGFVSIVRSESARTYVPAYGSGLAWGRWDTHGYLMTEYDTPRAYIGGGSADKLTWCKEIAFADHTHTYSDVGAAAASHTHNYVPTSGGAITSSSFGSFIIHRTGSINGASIGFHNDLGRLGYIGMKDSIDGGLYRYSADTVSQYKVHDDGNLSFSLSGTTLTITKS